MFGCEEWLGKSYTLFKTRCYAGMPEGMIGVFVDKSAHTVVPRASDRRRKKSQTISADSVVRRQWQWQFPAKDIKADQWTIPKHSVQNGAWQTVYPAICHIFRQETETLDQSANTASRVGSDYFSISQCNDATAPNSLGQFQWGRRDDAKIQTAKKLK